MTTLIRPLTLSERKRPAQLTYFGGFKNVSFQIGEIVLPQASSRNTNETTPVYIKAIVRKSPTVQFPIMVPNALVLLKGASNTVASVIGQKNKFGGFDAVLVARGTERLSSFNSKLRTVEDLIKSADGTENAEDTRLGKSSNARTHNQVMLAGVVVGARFEDGENPKFHINLRQNANPDNIVPLIYEARSASAMVSKVKYGALIYVDGEYAVRNVPVYELDDSGNVKLNEDRKPIPALDEAGKPIKRIHTYIRITTPKDPAEFDTSFAKSIPRWITEIAQEIAQARSRSGTPASTIKHEVAGDSSGEGVKAKPIDSIEMNDL